MRLMREVRCFPDGEASGSPITNSWAGSPDGRIRGPFWVLRATVEGSVNQQTGYLCDIKALDALLREVLVPALHERASRRESGVAGAASGLIDSFPLAGERCPPPARLWSLQWCVSPFLSFTVISGDAQMVRVTQSFEFSAAHRLYCDDLSDEENRRVFGKCSNANGHGHNYVLEVTVSGPPDPAASVVVDPAGLQRKVQERVIARFDHKHLNLDCVEFRSLNPSVENIARVIWDRLVGAFEDSRLVNIRVWETPKTYAEYDGS